MTISFQAKIVILHLVLMTLGKKGRRQVSLAGALACHITLGLEEDTMLSLSAGCDTAQIAEPDNVTSLDFWN